MNYFLFYKIGDIKIATEINETKEVIRPRQIIYDEKLPKNLAGFFELRGKKLWIYDLPGFLDIESGKDFEVIVTEINRILIGFKVEKVYGIVSAERIIPYPEIVGAKDYLTGVIKTKEGILQVLSFTKLLAGPRLKAIKKYL